MILYNILAQYFGVGGGAEGELGNQGVRPNKEECIGEGTAAESEGWITDEEPGCGGEREG